MLGFNNSSDERSKASFLRIFTVATFCLLVYYIGFHSTDHFSGVRVQEVGSAKKPSPPDIESPTEAKFPTNVEEPLPAWRNPYRSASATSPEEPVSRTLVMGKLSTQHTSWIKEELFDLLHHPTSPLQTAVYTANDPNAPLHPPVNKGHEAMIYLTWIIDNYEQLPEIAIFMHFHQVAWHNDDLLDNSATEMIRHLSSEKVLRDGYMNLRCQWEPGCPNWIHPKKSHFTDDRKKEEWLFAKAFREIFPDDPVPDTLAQPCCAQFAVSGERIKRHPLQKYIDIRTWLEETDLNDYTSGRIFEYIWQYLFTSSPIACPNMHICYCDGYSICFETEISFVQYTDIQDVYRTYWSDLELWKQQEAAHELGQGEAPEQGRDLWLRRNIDDLWQEIYRRKQSAAEIGKDRVKKYEVLARAWDELNWHAPGYLAEKYGHFGVDSAISPV